MSMSCSATLFLCSSTLRAASRSSSARIHTRNPIVPSHARLISSSAVVRKSKSSFASEPAPSTQGDVPVINTKGKGAKGASKEPRGAKSKRGVEELAQKDDDRRYTSSTENQEMPGEKFEENILKDNMQRAVQRCKETISQKVASYGRADPSILDSIQITFTPQENSSGQSSSGSTSSEMSGGQQSYPLKDFASVGVKDGALLVTCFDVDSVKHVERAIYTADIGLSPQHVSGAEGVLRLPIARPTAESRAQLVKEVNRICENAKVSIRSARQIAQKQIKSDEKGKIVGRDEANREMKKMEEETKKQSAEVDQVFEKTKKRIEQG